MDLALQLHPGRPALTPAHENKAQRFADVYVRAQLSTEPAYEREAETSYARRMQQEDYFISFYVRGSQRWLKILTVPL